MSKSKEALAQEIPRFSREDKERILKIFTTWITVATKEDYKPLKNWENASAEIYHSALLQRLLDGKEPLPVAPPRAYSYPWYSLVEEGWSLAWNPMIKEERTVKIWGMAPLDHIAKEPSLLIAQSLWKILETLKINDHDAWRVENGPWRATVMWEEGPFNLGMTIKEEIDAEEIEFGLFLEPKVPTKSWNVMGPAYVIRLETAE